MAKKPGEGVRAIAVLSLVLAIALPIGSVWLFIHTANNPPPTMLERLTMTAVQEDINARLIATSALLPGETPAIYLTLEIPSTPLAQDASSGAGLRLLEPTLPPSPTLSGIPSH